MKSEPSLLSRAIQVIAGHPSPAHRFYVAGGLLCDLALKDLNDSPDHAAERALDRIAATPPNFERARFLSDDAGYVHQIALSPPYEDHDLFMLAAEFSLLPSQTDRVACLEAACITLLKDPNAAMHRLVQITAESRAFDMSSLRLA